MLFLDPKECSLEGFKIRCVGDLNKTMVGGNKKARAILVEQARIFHENGKAEIMTKVCYGHNVGRLADTPAARKILLLQKIYEFGWFHTKEWFDVLLATFKRYPTELELERLLSI